MRLYNFRYLVLIFTLLTSFSLHIKAEEWNGIIPLKTSRADAEQIVGECKENNPLLCLYKMEEQKVFITYSTADACKEKYSFNVPAETVLAISVYPFSPKSIEELSINLSNFIEDESGCVVGSKSYFDYNKGLALDFNGSQLKSFHYYPSKEDEEIYQCK